MRKIFFTALVALCAALPGRLEATSEISSFSQINMQAEASDPTVVEMVLRQMEVKHGISYEDLRIEYINGDLNIENVAHECYKVTRKASGGIGIIIDINSTI